MAGRFEQDKKRSVPVLSVSIAVLILVCIAAVCFLVSEPEEPVTGLERIELRLEDTVLISVTESERVHEIKELLSGAEDIGYTPKTFILGPELVYCGTDGQTVALELDLDSDLFRYDGRFFNYGPGNDNNAMPKLWELLGMQDWPEEVKTAFPEWFASIEEGTVPTVSYRQQSVYMDLWYPDWRYVKIQEAHALVILDALRQEEPVLLDREKVPVEQSSFTIHIAYDDGREYDLACVGDEEFLLWEGGTEAVYGFSNAGFRGTVEEMITLSMEHAE